MALIHGRVLAGKAVVNFITLGQISKRTAGNFFDFKNFGLVERAGNVGDHARGYGMKHDRQNKGHHAVAHLNTFGGGHGERGLKNKSFRTICFIRG